MRFRRALSAVVGFVCVASGLAVVTAGNATADDESGTGGVFVPVTPHRLVDARGVAGSTAKFAPGEIRDYTVLSQSGIPASGVSAVVVDLAAASTTATGNSYLTVWPTGTTRPGISSLQYTAANVPRSNTAIVPVGTDGKISVYNYNGTTGLTVDVQGYFTASSDGASPGGYVPVSPVRATNTSGTHEGEAIAQVPLPVGQSRDIQITGIGDISADATAVFANIEARSPTNVAGQLKVGPGGVEIASNVPAAVDYGISGFYDTGLTLKLSSNGKARVTNWTGSPVNFRIDVQGYFSGNPEEGGSFTPLVPRNLYNSSGIPDPLAAGEYRTVQVAGLAGIPEEDAAAVAMTVTARDWSAGGFVTVFNADEDRTGTSNVGFSQGVGSPGNGIGSTAIVELSTEGEVTIYNGSTAPVNVMLTAQGWFHAQEVDEPADDAVPVAQEPIPCAAGGECKPVLATGTAPEAVGNIGIFVDPSDGATAESDVEIPMELLDADVQVDGDNFTVRVDPADVPVQYASEDGVLNLELLGEGDTLGWGTSFPTRVVSVEDELGAEWADVGEVTDPTLQRAAASASRPTSSVASLAVELPEEVAGSSGAGFSATAIPAESILSSPLVASRSGSGSDVTPMGAGCIVMWTNQQKTPNATIGTSYPTDGGKSWMEVTSASGAEYGVGVSVNGGKFAAEGSASAKGGWSFEWPESSKSRSYQTPVRYRKKKRTCYYYKYTEVTERWIAINEVGTTTSKQGIKRPNFTHCSPQDAGKWSRFESKGKQYKLGTSVKFASIIGIDLSTARSYNENQRLWYRLKRKGRLCGNNADPGIAGKVMHKKKAS